MNPLDRLATVPENSCYYHILAAAVVDIRCRHCTQQHNLEDFLAKTPRPRIPRLLPTRPA